MEAKKNPKAFYSYVRSKLATRDGIADLNHTSGGVANTDAKKAEVLK